MCVCRMIWDKTEPSLTLTLKQTLTLTLEQTLTLYPGCDVCVLSSVCSVCGYFLWAPLYSKKSFCINVFLSLKEVIYYKRTLFIGS